MNTSLHINGVDYDAAKVVNTIIENKEPWKTPGMEFLIQLLDTSEFPVKFKTSGTTGIPKEIFFSKKQIAQSADNSCRFFNIKEGDTFFLCLPAQFVAGRMMIARALSIGAKLIWIEPVLNPDLGNAPIDFAAFTPAQVATLLNIESTKKRFASILKVIIGGGEISQALEMELRRFSNEIYATYGMTETLTHVAVRKVGEDVYTSVYRDAKFSVDQNGCLEISIPFISSEKLVTHDMVELVSDHAFIWKGRLDNVINTGGIKIYAEDIEKRIVQQGIIGENEFYISSAHDAVFGQVPVIVMLKDRMKEDMATLLKRVNGLLNKHEHVKHVHFLDKFEFTPTGKLKRQRF